jgi:hypothetical protein
MMADMRVDPRGRFIIQMRHWEGNGKLAAARKTHLLVWEASTLLEPAKIQLV